MYESQPPKSDDTRPRAIEYPELPDDLKRGFNLRMFGYFGAGAIITSVTIGSGETYFASKAGAIFGYSLLWCFLGGTLMKGVQVYTAARHITLTGEHPMTHWVHIPGPRNWVPILIGFLSLAVMPFWLAGLPMMLGNTLNWIFGVDVALLDMTADAFDSMLKNKRELLPPDHADLVALEARRAQYLLYTRGWASLSIVIAVALTCLQTYNVLEKVQTLIVGILLASLFAATMATLVDNPQWLALLEGLVPSLPDYPAWYPEHRRDQTEFAFLGVCLGAIGGGTYDYLGYIGCFREKNWGALGLEHRTVSDTDVRQDAVMPIDTSQENIERGRRWLLPVKIDVGIGFLAILIFTCCFIILGAAILHPDKEVPGRFELFTKQARFLTDFSPALLYVYQLGMFMAIWGTIYGAYEIYIRTAYECLAPISSRVRNAPSKRFRAWMLLYCALGGLSLLWVFENPAKLVEPAAIVGGVFTCGLWCFAMIWADRRYLPPQLRMSRLLLVLTILSGTVLTVLGAVAIWNMLIDWYEWIAARFTTMM